MGKVLRLLTAVVATLSLPLIASAQKSAVFAPFGFMLGDWTAAGNGTGAGAGGSSAIHMALGGRAIERRDRIIPKDGAPFDAWMIVYPEANGIRAEFFDSEGHIIHYAGRVVAAGCVQFLSEGSAIQPGYRLTYQSLKPDVLHIKFEIAPPGGAFKAYTEGDLNRVGRAE